MPLFNQALFAELAKHWDLVWSESIDSTNAAAKRAIDAGKARSGQVYLAEQQTAGVGRRGSSWLCGKSEGLLFTAVVETEFSAKETGKLAIASALAVADVLNDYGITPQLKWPNDVYVNEAKIAGILVEQIGDFTLFGIGLNTNITTLITDNVATSMHLHTNTPVKRERVLASALASLLRRISCHGVFSQLLLDWQKWDYLADQVIQMKLSNEIKVARYAGISSHGGILIEAEDGLEEIVSAEEIRIVREI